jgi:Domain of unknown function (DUF222)
LLPEIADLAAMDDASLVDAAAGRSRTENAACARKLAIMAELFARRTGLPAGEREDWWVGPQAAAGAELGAAQGISTWMALAQAHRGVVLADRFPKVAALFEAGVNSELLVRVIEYRTALITDPDAMAAVDELLADHASGCPLSANKTDPRTRGERRTEALAALAAGIRELACECGNADCRGAQRDATPPAAAVIHVVADADAVVAARTETAGTARPADLAMAEDAQPQPAFCPPPPAFVIGGGLLPAPLLAAMLERATVREIRHPGDAPPEPRYTPSRSLADFVRCRDFDVSLPEL